MFALFHTFLNIFFLPFPTASRRIPVCRYVSIMVLFINELHASIYCFALDGTFDIAEVLAFSLRTVVERKSDFTEMKLKNKWPSLVLIEVNEYIEGNKLFFLVRKKLVAFRLILWKLSCSLTVYWGRNFML